VSELKQEEDEAADSILFGSIRCPIDVDENESTEVVEAVAQENTCEVAGSEKDDSQEVTCEVPDGGNVNPTFCREVAQEGAGVLRLSRSPRGRAWTLTAPREGRVSPREGPTRARHVARVPREGAPSPRDLGKAPRERPTAARMAAGGKTARARGRATRAGPPGKSARTKGQAKRARAMAALCPPRRPRHPPPRMPK